MGNSVNNTMMHKTIVKNSIKRIIKELTIRAGQHDNSKLCDPEKSVYDEYSDQLHQVKYGSKEYEAIRQKMESAIEHHFEVNRHHPEHFPGGIKEMNLVDIIEMLCDWKARADHDSETDIIAGIEINQQKFGFSDDLKQIFINTVLSMDKNFLDNE